MDNGASSYRRLLNGDDAGIVEIIKDYKDGLIIYLNCFVQNIYAAEELAEETFIKLVVNKPTFSKKSTFKTWLYAIGRNVAIDYTRHNSKISDTPIEDYLTYFEGFDNTQAAAIMKKNNRQVENLVYRAKMSLKSELEKEGFYYEEL